MTSAVAGFQIQMKLLKIFGVVFTPNPSTVPTTVTNALRCAAKKKVKYGEVWGLARQAAQLAIEFDSYNEIVGWLKVFITRTKKLQSLSQRKGRPETKRYKSSTEKKSHVKYACKTCGRTGHNSARCQNW
uniref:CCHC-type domain-containing protein n=1 Tax=Rhizophagus irregularis (strain DAOM 181602 / DAOM 197198 / MUCL 43194) TaxID=747089 RepID=U9U329_RHIID